MAVSPKVEEMFREELARRGFQTRPDPDGSGYTLDIEELTVSASLENLSREYERDGDRERIVRFVDSIVAGVKLPPWEEAIRRIRWSPEPSHIEREDVFCQEVSDRVVLVLVYISEDDTMILWLTPALTEAWQHEEEDLWSAAAHNMNALLEQTEISVEEHEGHQLGIIVTEHDPFKAGLLFAPNLREKTEPALGWPLFAVAPCRDTVYLLAERERDFLPNLGHVVVSEHSQSPYPVSTEVYEIGDDGVGAFAEFQSPANIDVDEDGMRTIDIAEALYFRLPATWREEYPEEEEDEEDFGVLFYDPDAESGTFRVFLQQYTAPEPLTETRVREILNNTDEPNKSDIVDLEGGSLMLTYFHEPEDEVEPVAIYTWQVAHILAHDTLYVALFSLTVELDDSDEKAVDAQRTLLDREIRACRFSDDPIA